MREVKVFGTNNEMVIGDRIAVADTSFTRMFGLLGRRSLDAGEGLWITPSSGVHTLGMRFPIDVIGLDKNRKVTRLWRNLVPQRLTSITLSVRSVIELPAGAIERSGVALGDTLHMT